MKNELKSLLEEILKEHAIIKFDLAYAGKGCDVELEIGDKKNEYCGIIYDKLSYWLAYDEFIDYLIDKGVYHNFSGEIFFENSEICFFVILNGNYYEYDDSEIKYIEFSEDFILNELKIDLSNFGMNDTFEGNELSVNFYKEMDTSIERLELINNKDWCKIELDQNQLITLINFLESEIERAIPSFNINFECEILWTLECEDNCLNFYYSSTPIKLKLNEILS
ncbi:hypothetical protein FBBAL38_00010 [Flavobacteria bacterium BAL38]|nr:hypothetical protein FBBAL38_00010 [Flavobacteria bacterium BAL38]